MSTNFPILEIPSNAPIQTEELGTKEKFWFQHQDLGLCLFKKARPRTGEAWSEKIASELCELIQLPHAIYELASFDDRRGVITPSFIPKEGSLILGNEVLSRLIKDYPQTQDLPSQHTVSQVLEVLSSHALHLPINWTPLDGVTNPDEVFVGYLMLDAWISNTDRHHENWGIVRIADGLYLAPTYDHAACLGQLLTDEERERRLTTKDSGYSIQAYVGRGKSCLYSKVTAPKRIKLCDAFLESSQLHPAAANIWLDSLARIQIGTIRTLFQQIPDDWISQFARDFAIKMLEINRERLLGLRRHLQ